MIIGCPECSTRFLSSAEAIGPNGRTVRCSSCSSTWFVKPQPDILELAVPKETSKLSPQASPIIGDLGASGSHAASSIRIRAQEKKVFRRIFGVSMMWITVLAILALAALLAYVFRQSIVDKFPASSTLYKAFDIEVAAGGLVFGDVVMRSAYVEDELTILVEGQVRNPDNNSHPIREVQLSLHDVSGQQLAQWSATLEKDVLAKGAAASFTSHYKNPPIDAISLHYRFEGDQNSPPRQNLELHTQP